MGRITMPAPAEALAGRPDAVAVPAGHFVHGRPLTPPFPDELETAVFALGCFWGAERLFWELDGVHTTAVGYTGGYTPNPSYKEVCSGLTGHAEAVLVVFDPTRVAYADLLAAFWENHDPTQGMRQGNDIGTQYRSVIYANNDLQRRQALASRAAYQTALSAGGLGLITTTVEPRGPFYYAEDYHQQYLAKNPQGYCGLAGTGVACPVGLPVPATAGSHLE